ncbi:MAG: PLP-dependent aminotransferase family protein [Bacillota bacterium]|nr:PLP-dependent aminotransferase family protein [Bacillota bacterium]
MSHFNIILKDNEVPKYIQIQLHIKKLIDLNRLKDGEKLPPIRELSESLGVNKSTVINSYKKLEEEGYIVQKIGSGTFVKKKDGFKNIKRQYSEMFKKINSDMLKSYIDFTGETTNSTFFPVNVFKEVINDVLERDGVNALVYQELLGYEGLRKSIVGNFWGNSVSAEDVLIVSGAQQGLDIISKALLGSRDCVVMEKPTYSGALAVFNWKRAEIHEIDIEEDGINTTELENILKRNKVKFLYVMSYFQNPTGITYSREKKLEILRLADIYDFYIIEDDYLSELIYNPEIRYESFKSMDTGNRVIYIKSFSKIFLPGIRIGYVLAPPKFKEAIQNAKINSDISTSSLMQRALELYINTGYWRNHIANLNDIYIVRYSFMLELLRKYLGDLAHFKAPGGGFNFYLKLRGDIIIDSFDLFNRCRRSKVLITPGAMFYRNVEDGRRCFRIGFSQTDEKDIEEGLKKIRKIILGSD